MRRGEVAAHESDVITAGRLPRAHSPVGLGVPLTVYLLILILTHH